MKEKQVFFHEYFLRACNIGMYHDSHKVGYSLGRFLNVIVLGTLLLLVYLIGPDVLWNPGNVRLGVLFRRQFMILPSFSFHRAWLFIYFPCLMLD